MDAVTHALTDRQRQVLAFVHNFCWQRGRPPAWRDITAHFGWTSTHAVSCHIDRIRKKGGLRKASRPSECRALVPAGYLLVTAAGAVLPVTDAEVAGLLERGRTRDLKGCAG